MNQDDMKNIRKKAITAFVLMAVLIIPIGFLLFSYGRNMLSSKEKEMEQFKVKTFFNIVSLQEKEALAAEKRFDRNLSLDVQLMTSHLRGYVTESGYSGPRLLSEGFVARIEGDKVVVPKGLPEGKLNLSPELIQSSLESGEMRTGSLLLKEGNEEENGSDGYDLSFGLIAENVIYVEMTEKEWLSEYMETYTSRSLSAAQASAEVFEGVAFIASDKDGTLEQLEKYGSESESANLSDLGITSDMIARKRLPNVTLDGRTYRCISTKTEFSWGDRENIYMIQLLPVHDIERQAVVQSVMTCLLMLLIFATVIVFAVSEQRFVMCSVLTSEESGKYNPARLRLRVISSGVIGALSILCITLMAQAIGNMHQQIRSGKAMMDVMAGQIETAIQEQDERAQQEEEEWFVRFAERIAWMAENDPEKVTQEELLKYRDILSVDYIMLFDSKGQEILSSNEYKDFTLDNRTGEKFYDFRRLLMGIPSIVHETAEGDVTQLNRQMIGVRMKDPDDPEKYGALLMALMPEQTQVMDDAEGVDQVMQLLETERILCFEADSSDGTIMYSSERSLEGKRVKECGLSEKSLQDNYMDFGKVNGINCFIVTSRHGDSIFYYTVAYDTILKDNLLFSLIAVLLFLLLLIIISYSVLREYNTEFIKKWSAIQFSLSKEKKEAGLLEKKTSATLGNAASKVAKLKEKAAGHRKNFLESVKNYLHWDTRLPEEKAGTVYSIGLTFLLLLLQVYLMLDRQDVYGYYDTLFEYLLYGDWMRGVNLFSLCGIGMVFSLTHLAGSLSGWILNVISGFLSTKGETICKLIKSLLKYILIAVAIVLSLYYIGVLNSTVIASLGLGSLALSLGAKDLVADILAGIFIVFDETLRVGDIVEYDGKTGTVQEIGMRYTRLQIPVGNILNVSNQEIRSVMNLSKLDSYCSLAIRISSKIPELELEEMLNRELPAIGEKCSLIRGPVTLNGITALGGNEEMINPISLKTVSIGTVCEQKNMYAVRLFLNREIGLLFEREGIEYY